MGTEGAAAATPANNRRDSIVVTVFMGFAPSKGESLDDIVSA
jgi:hypothetical protein